MFLSVILFSTQSLATAKRRGRQESTTMPKVIAFAFFLCLASFAGSASAAGTPEEQRACQDDAFKFCGEVIPDEEKVKACLIHNLRRLTPACRKLFPRGRRR
jgi:hypothetical protein